MKEIKNIEDLISLFESAGYYGTEDIMMEAYLGLTNFGGKIKPGQDIRAVCLDGPPGSGKTSFVENYVEIYKKLCGEEVEFINYECNDTTGKSDLYEEINIGSAIKRDADNILIEGCLTEAIRKVNEGKKVILLLDEFDKSRTETDVFFFKFLQSGEINTTQHGILRVKDEYKTNLQVFFCKNDLRELSGPLMRRTRSVKLECMTPDRFNDVARSRLLIQNKNDFLENLINLVTLIYEFSYNNQARFERIPSCSEMMIAICDAYDISTELNATSKQTYNIILKRMFKDEDDFQTFIGLLKASTKEEDKTLKEFLSELSDNEEEIRVSLKDKMLSELFKYDDRIKEKIQEAEQELLAYKKRFDAKLTEMEEAKSKVSSLERKKSSDIQSIPLDGGKLVLGEDINFKSLFMEEKFIKRGMNVFNTFEKNDASMIGSIKFEGFDHYKVLSSLIKDAEEFNFVIYENGILLFDNEVKLAITVNFDSSNNTIYEFYINNVICPSSLLEKIHAFCCYINLLNNKENNLLKSEVNIDTLIYNDQPLVGYDLVEGDNIYHIFHKGITLDQLKDIIDDKKFTCSDFNKVMEAGNNSLKLKK